MRAASHLYVRWLGIALCALALCVVVLVVALEDVVVPCRAELRPVPEPPSWRSWPTVAAADAGYAIDGTLEHPSPLFVELHVTAPGVCPGGELSLDAWLSAHGEPDVAAMYHRPDQLTLRRAPGEGGVLVVEGHEEPRAGHEHEGDPSVFVAAFRRDDSRRAYVSTRGWWLLAGIGVAIVSLLAAMAASVAAFVSGRLVTDARRTRDGVRDAAGLVRLVDDGSIVVSPPAGPAGPVLVRVRSAHPGRYRESPAARPARVWNGSRDSVLAASRAAATRLLRRAVLFVACLAIAMTVGGCALEVLEGMTYVY